MTDPLADPWLMVAAALLGTVAGIVTLRLLLRAAAPVEARGSPTDTDPTVRAGSRRSFLAWSAGAVAATTAGVAAGRGAARPVRVGDGRG